MNVQTREQKIKKEKVSDDAVSTPALVEKGGYFSKMSDN